MQDQNYCLLCQISKFFIFKKTLYIFQIQLTSKGQKSSANLSGPHKANCLIQSTFVFQWNLIKFHPDFGTLWSKTLCAKARMRLSIIWCCFNERIIMSAILQNLVEVDKSSINLSWVSGKNFLANRKQGRFNPFHKQGVITTDLFRIWNSKPILLVNYFQRNRSIITILKEGL